MGASQAELSASVLRYAAQGALRFLENSAGWRQLSLAEDQFHTGDDPIVADAESHAQFTRFATGHPAFQELRIWGIVGEENIQAVPPRLQPGARVIVLDPLDGSWPWAMIRAGYCVAALTLIAGSDGVLKLESAIVATPTHTFTLVGDDDLRFGPTFGGPANDMTLLSTLPENELIDPSMAFGGYKTKDRETVTRIMTRLDKWSVITLGGNPVSPYVVTGGLTAAITLRPQCTWDAIGILMCTATDAVVGLTNGDMVSGSTFRDLFGKVLLTGNVRIIPPMIVAKSRDRFSALCDAVSKDTDPGSFQ
jgi:hypothetical protein